MVHHYRKDVINNLNELGIKQFCEFEKSYTSTKFGLCLDWIDMHLLNTSVYFAEVFKGLFNRFPLVPKHPRQFFG